MENDDLTASHWDDVLSPSHNPSFTNLNNTYVSPVLNNEFNVLSIDNDSYKKQYSDYEDEEAHGDGDDNGDVNDLLYKTKDEEYDPIKEAERDQLHDIRNERKHNLLSELTNGSEDIDMEASLSSPQKVDPSDSLFNDKGSPMGVLTNNKTISNNNKNENTASDDINSNHVDSLSSPKRSSHLKNGKFRAPRQRRYPSKVVTKHLNGNSSKQHIQYLEQHSKASLSGNQSKSPEPQVKEDPLLGPLGNQNDESNDKSSIKSVPKADQLVQEVNAPLYDLPTTSEEDRLKELSKPKALPSFPINSPTNNETTTTTNHDQDSISIDDSKSNKLEITVGDPMKVGDITSAHIIYSIKVRNKNLDSQYWPADLDTKTVTRRYKDFRWIYHQLQNNHPGKIIPPPPTKQTYIGRFNENFIENRRLSLEKMLYKISSLPKLCNDQDFVMFLISDDFINESKERERLSGSGASLQNNDFLDNDGIINNNHDNDSSIGSNSSISAPLITGVGTGGSGSSFMSSLFSISNKINEPDEYFANKKVYIDELEFNLKNFYKSIDLIGIQRVEMIGVLDEISITIEELANFEILKVTTNLLEAFSEVQLKLKENLDRINLQDHLTLGFTIEEYLRIIGSIKFIFETRFKIYQQYYNFKQELNKKQSSLDKLNKKYKSSVDKINQLTFEVDKLSQKTTIYENKFTSISETIKEEIEHFEIGKIDDFRNSVEIFIESSIESQKEAIELWETFYERQNLSKV